MSARELLSTKPILVNPAQMTPIAFRGACEESRKQCISRPNHKGGSGDFCAEDADCRSLKCLGYQCVGTVRAKAVLGEPCDGDDGCLSGTCRKHNAQDVCVTTFRNKGHAGAPCSSNIHCFSKKCHKTQQVCFGTIDQTAAHGQPCYNDEGCISNNCNHAVKLCLRGGEKFRVKSGLTCDSDRGCLSDDCDSYYKKCVGTHKRTNQ